VLPSRPKVWQLVTTPSPLLRTRDNPRSLRPPSARRNRPRNSTPASLSLSLLDVSPQISENTATLSPFAATLTGLVKPKSCVCHSYKKHRGGWVSFARPLPKIVIPIPSQTCHPEGIEGSAFSSGFTDHWTRTTGHRITAHRTTAHERLDLSARLRALCASALSFSAFRSQALAGNRYFITSLLLCFTAPPYSRKDND
jgi:hypothetical protein